MEEQPHFRTKSPSVSSNLQTAFISASKVYLLRFAEVRVTCLFVNKCLVLDMVFGEVFFNEFNCKRRVDGPFASKFQQSYFLGRHRQIYFIVANRCPKAKRFEVSLYEAVLRSVRIQFSSRNSFTFRFSGNYFRWT